MNGKGQKRSVGWRWFFETFFPSSGPPRDTAVFSRGSKAFFVGGAGLQGNACIESTKIWEVSWEFRPFFRRSRRYYRLVYWGRIWGTWRKTPLRKAGTWRKVATFQNCLFLNGKLQNPFVPKKSLTLKVLIVKNTYPPWNFHIPTSTPKWPYFERRYLLQMYHFEYSC